MNDSVPAVPEIYGAINRIMAKIGHVAKEGKNEAQGYKFRGIDQFINAAHPALVAEGVFCCPTVLEQTLETYEGVNASGKPTRSFRVLLRVEHRFYAKDGSSIAVVTCGEGLDTSDKATNKAMSASQKYALIQLLMVPTADMAEADKDSPETDGSKVTKAAMAFSRPQMAISKANIEAGIALTESELNRIAPLPPLEKLVASATQAPGFIDRPRQVNFAKSFREALPKALQPRAEAIRHEWLQRHMYIDADGNPSATMIPMATFEEVKALAVKFAGEQQ